uniref:Cathepsin D-like aspartic peptidase n=1 Tax=Coptotermes formosanus TaxID=36987 RepID=R4V1E0_COPFO|nr:cathepsin D-like aspartic peptidase [Coptotermes formosanus]
MTFAEMTTESLQFAVAQFDGILGLAFQNISVDSIDPPLKVLYDKGLIDKYMVSFRLGKVSGETGQVTVGGFDPTQYIGNLNWVPVSKELWWYVDMDDILVDGKSLGLCSAQKCHAVIDTGTSLIIGKKELIDPIKKNVNVDLFCKDIDNNPTITFVLAGVHYPLKPSEYILDVGVEGIHECIPGIEDMDLGDKMDFILLGDVFLRVYYSVYDMNVGGTGGPRVGFARAIDKN